MTVDEYAEVLTFFNVQVKLSLKLTFFSEDFFVRLSEEILKVIGAKI